MKKSIEMLRAQKHFLILGYYGVIIGLYTIANHLVSPDHLLLTMHSPILDDKIPFVKYMVVPYSIWFPYIVVPLLYFGFVEKDMFYKLCRFIFVGMTACLLFDIVVPNGIGNQFRPVLIGNDIFTGLVRLIYFVDKPVNSCPSMHVYTAVGVQIAVMKSHVLRSKKGLRALSSIMCAAILCSTVMIKQHSIIDVIVAGLLCGVLYTPCFTGVRKKVKYGDALSLESPH